ncbi:MAG: LysM peptidoglycan-binding domain-containing protein [Bacteroidota bacterium]
MIRYWAPILFLFGLLVGKEASGQSKQYPFIDTIASVFQFSGSYSVNQLYQQWQNRFTQKFVVIELGNEEVITQQQLSLSWLQKMQISPGIFFPSSFLGINHPSIFPNTHTGNWIYSTTAENFPLIKPGICGYTAKCEDAASSSLTIEIPEELRKTTNKIRIYCDRNEASFDVLLITSSGIKKTITVYQNKSDLLVPYIEFTFSFGQEWIKIQPLKSQSKQKSFTLHGVSLEHSDYAVWHAIGIRGISLQRLQSIDGYFLQMQKLSPSVVVFDALQQDFFRNKPATDIQLSLKSYYQSLKRYLPKTGFVLCLPQEINRNQEPLAENYKFISQFRTEFISNSYPDWVIWDWHRVSGGIYSSYYWMDSGLLKSNGFQLSENGMRIKSYSLNRAFQQLLSGIPVKSRILPLIDSTQQLKKPIKDTAVSKPIIRETWLYHTVKYGETAYRISSKYSISPNDLKNWNNLRGYYIYPGQKLKVGKVTEVIQPIIQTPLNNNVDSFKIIERIETTKNLDISNPTNGANNRSILVNPIYPKQDNTQNSQAIPSGQIPATDKITTPKGASATNSPKYHRVQASETLYSIAKQHGVSVDQIKRLNRLPNNTISVGRVLRVW